MRVRLPRMNLDKRKKRMLIVSMLILSVFLTSSYMFSAEQTRDIFDYGTANYHVITGGVSSTLSAGATVYADVSDIRVLFTWRSIVGPPDAGYFHAVLHTSIVDTIEDVYSTKTGDVYSFDFDLKKSHQGTFDYYISLYCTTGANNEFFYSGKSFTFTVVNAFQTVSAPEWVELPEDVPEQVIGYPETLSWKYKYNAPATLTLEMDGVIVDTKGITGSPYTQQYFYVYDPQEPGSHRFRLILDPDEILHLSIWDEVDVGVVTWEDYVLVEGVPDELDGVGIQIDSKLAYIKLDIQHRWIEETDNVPTDVYALPKTEPVLTGCV